ncbi:MAG: BatA and WFA domain-containing protein [Pirellulales bacterium]|nr:BatA and WFA domain-containing protein [Pirellulales bacterium]
MTFLAPLFLIGALAGIIPVLLHLMNRRKAKELPFATLRFLRRGVEKTRRRRRVQDLLLMLLRVAVLVLIALGLARPTITRLGALWGQSGSAVAIVLDNSASMGTVDRDVVRFETARRAAAQVLDQLADGDQVALLLTGGPPFPEQGRLDRAHQRVRQTLAACRASYQRADLATALAHAHKILVECDATDKQIYLISDLQAVSWETGVEGPGARDRGRGTSGGILRSAQNDREVVQNNGDQANETVDDEATAIPVIVVDCYRTPKPNAAVQSVKLDAPAPVRNVPLRATVELFGAAATPQQRHVDLFLDGAKTATSPALDVPPGGRAAHDFTFSFRESGLHQGEARLVGEDGSALDDRRFFAVSIDRGIPVALVKPRQHEIAYLDDAFYLERALAPGASGGGAIRPTVLLADDLAREPLAPYRIVFCVNLPALDAEAAAKLADFVAGGGNLVWLCGDNVDPAAYNQMNDAAGGRLLPAPLVDLRAPATDAGRDSWRVAKLDTTHPALAAVAQPASLYESILVYKHVRVDESHSGVRVLARLDDGEALLVERNVGRGCTLFWATGAHVDWTNWPLRPIFLPMLVRLAFALAGAENERNETLAGAPVALAGAELGGSQGVEVRRPSGETVRLPTEAKGSGRTFRYTDTYDVGVYVFRPSDPAAGGPAGVAVNVDPAEADPARIEPERLRSLLGGAPVVFADNPDDLATTFARLREGESLWELFLIAVLVALVVESFVANRFTPKSEKANEEITTETRRPRR